MAGEQKSAAKKRAPGRFKVFVADGVNDKGEEIFSLKGEATAGSARLAVQDLAEKGLKLNAGEEVVVIKAAAWQAKPVTLSI